MGQVNVGSLLKLTPYWHSQSEISRLKFLFSLHGSFATWVELSNSQRKKGSKKWIFANNCLVNIAESLGVVAMHHCVLKHV